MKILFDTHAFLWWDSEPERLSALALEACTDPSNELYLSIASLWEMQIKIGLGKLLLRLSLESILQHQQSQNSLQILPILPSHIFALASLPSLHKDPFDRLLVSQAGTEGCCLLSSDSFISQYPIDILW